MIMRADGALRVMLNSPVFEGMNYGDAKNKAPTNKQIFLASTEGDRTVPLLLRVSLHPSRFRLSLRVSLTNHFS